MEAELGGGQWTGTGAGDGSGRHTGIGDSRTIGDGDGSSGSPAAEAGGVDARPAGARDDEAVGRGEARLDVEHVLRPARHETASAAEAGKLLPFALANSAGK